MMERQWLGPSELKMLKHQEYMTTYQVVSAEWDCQHLVGFGAVKAIDITQDSHS